MPHIASAYFPCACESTLLYLEPPHVPGFCEKKKKCSSSRRCFDCLLFLSTECSFYSWLLDAFQFSNKAAFCPEGAGSSQQNSRLITNRKEVAGYLSKNKPQSPAVFVEQLAQYVYSFCYLNSEPGRFSVSFLCFWSSLFKMCTKSGCALHRLSMHQSTKKRIE